MTTQPRVIEVKRGDKLAMSNPGFTPDVHTSINALLSGLSEHFVIEVDFVDPTEHVVTLDLGDIGLHKVPADRITTRDFKLITDLTAHRRRLWRGGHKI